MKRIFSFLLAALLVVTLIPLQAHATEQTDFLASTELVEVIKKWEGFAKYPVWDYGQYSVGYGTAAPAEHLDRYRAEGISEEEATELLHGYMNNMGASVNSFIKKHKLKVNQGQFDAMLSLTYNCGARWMLEVSTLRTAILDGWTGSDFIFAFGQWSTAGGVTLPGLVRRRLAEANMYLNGEYSTALPDNFCYVQFNANGGKAEVITQGYDSNDKDVAIRSVPVYDKYTFEGWYTDPTGGEKVEKLDATVKGYTLYAHWRAGSGSDLPTESEDEITGKKVSYSREITALSLNAFRQPVKGALVVGSYNQHEIVDITEEYTDSNGVKWGKVGNDGWINLSFTQEPDDGEEIAKVKVKVTGTDVNVRRGPGTSYAVVAKVTVGDTLEITRTTTAGGYTWGKFDKGWVALKYTNYDSAVNDSIESEGTQQKPVMGTVNVNEFLRIRENPGVGNAVVGMLGPKDRVEILEQKAVGGTIWGRIDRGWISMDYIILDKEGTTPEKPTEPEETIPPTTEPEETVPPTTEPEDTTPPETQPEEKPEEPNKLTGKVKLNSGYLNVRSGPSTGYKICGKYANGAAVEILEQKAVGTTTWGRTDLGWVSMQYIKLDAAEKPAEPEKPAEQEKPTEPEKPAEQEKPTEPEKPAEQEKPTEPEKPVEQEKPAETTGKKGTVKISSGCLRVRAGAGTGYKVVDNLYNGDKVTVLETKTVGGTKWGRIADGWVCMDYIKLESASSEQTTTAVTGTVNVNEFLRIRSGAGTNYALVGYYHPGDKITITEFKKAQGMEWGRTDRGWVSMIYIVLDGNNKPAEDKNETANTLTGTVNGIGLRIRKGAGTNYAIVGTLTIGDKVTILETKTVSGMKWGRITKGWISLDYVTLN